MKRISTKRKIEILKKLRTRVKEGSPTFLKSKKRFTCNILLQMLQPEEAKSFIKWYQNNGIKYARKERRFIIKSAWFEKEVLAPRIRVIDKLIKDLERK